MTGQLREIQGHCLERRLDMARVDADHRPSGLGSVAPGSDKAPATVDWTRPVTFAAAGTPQSSRCSPPPRRL
jgi:hypothetical protein